MNRILTNQSQSEETLRLLRELLESRGEWFCTETRPRGAQERQQRPAILGRGDWELKASGGALHFCYWGESGARSWRVKNWRQAEGKLLIEVTRRAGAERATLELVPRASVADALAEVKAARLAACVRMAASARARTPGAEIEGVRLSAGARRSEPGRYARIVLRRRGAGGRVAVTGPVVPVNSHEADAVLASALAWWTRLCERAGAAGARRSACGSSPRASWHSRWRSAWRCSARRSGARSPCLRRATATAR
jgi:hypothetical protein